MYIISGIKEMKFIIRIFDADETLLDYRKSENYALDRLLTETGFTSDFSEAKLAYNRINDGLWTEHEKGLMSVKQLRIQRFEDFMNFLNIDTAAEEAARIYLKNFAEAAFLMEGAEDFLEKLKELPGVNLIISNGSKVTQYGRFFKAGFDDIFDKYIISEELKMKKPDYEIFEYALAPYPEVPKDRIIMIGDGLISDIKGGANYGIRTCWFNMKNLINNTDIMPDYTAADFNELYKILAEN